MKNNGKTKLRWVWRIGVNVSLPSLAGAIMIFPIYSGDHDIFKESLGLRTMAAYFLVFLFFVGAVRLIANLIGLISKKKRPKAFPALVGSLLMVCCVVGAFAADIIAEQSARKRAIENAAPIIKALEKYKSQRGDYPPELILLVPKHLPNIPHTGSAMIPPYRYKRKTEGPEKSYTLNIKLYGLGLHLSEMVYDPARPCKEERVNRPGECPGESCRCKGDWTYIVVE